MVLTVGRRYEIVAGPSDTELADAVSKPVPFRIAGLSEESAEVLCVKIKSYAQEPGHPSQKIIIGIMSAGEEQFPFQASYNTSNGTGWMQRNP